MPLKYVAKYEQPIPMPSNEVSKNAKWFLAVARSIWHLYSANRLSIGFGGTCLNTGKDISVKRKYMFNQQSVLPIIDQIDPIDEKTGKRILNIDFSPVDFHTKSLNIALSRIEAFNYVPKTVAIDSDSMNKKTIKANKARLSVMPEIAALSKEAGYQDEDSTGLDNPEDVDTLIELGSIGLQAEIDLKNAVEHSLLDCNYKLSLQPMFIRDIMTHNTCVGVVEQNIETSRPHVKYVDIERCFFNPSIYPDHRDTTMGGYVDSMSVPTLRQYFTKEKLAGNTKYNDVERTLEEICNTYSSVNGNSYPKDWNGQRGLMSYYKDNHYYPYDSFTISVMTCYVVASDTRTYVHGLTETGEWDYKRIRNTEQPSEGMTAEKATLQNVYRIRWVVGTDFVFDCGIDNKIVRTGKKGNKKANIPMVIFKSPHTSLMDRIIPKIDDINKLEYKERQLLKEMIPQPAFGIDMALMEENVTAGGQTLNPKELIDYFKKKGVLFYRSKNEFGEIEGGSQRPPIEFFKDPSVIQMIEIANRKSMLVQELRDLIGINDIADGSQTSPELLVGVTQMANQAVNNALSSEIKAYRQFMTSIGQMLMQKYEVALKEGEEIEGVYFDGRVRKEYKLSPELISQKAEFAFTLEMSLSSEDKENMRLAISQAYARGEMGSEEFITANMLISNDDIQSARLFMAKAEKKAKKEAHEQQMQLTQAQAAAQGDASVKSEEAKSQNTLIIDNNKHKNDLETAALNHQFKLKEIDRERQYEADIKDRQDENKLLHESVKQTMIGEQKEKQSSSI